jgi:hypothetical protein
MAAAVPLRANAQLLDLGETLGLEVPDLGGPIGEALEDLLPPPVNDLLPPLSGQESAPAPQELQRPAARTVVDHATALRAVQERRALPLNDLLRGVAGAYRGEVIDVRLIRHQDALLYEVKMVDLRGRVSVVYFNAANGTPANAPPG